MLLPELKWGLSLTPPDDAVHVEGEWSIPPQAYKILEETGERLVQTLYGAFEMHPPERGSVTIRWEREKTSPETSDASNS